MKFSTFIEVFVAALYNETGLTGRTEFRVGEILDRYGLTLAPSWRENFFQDSTLDALVDVRRHLGPVTQQRVSLSSEGLRWVEDELGDNVATFLEQHGAHYSGHETASEAVDSGMWTGLSSNFVFTEDKRAMLVRYLEEAEANLDTLGAGNQEKAQARAYIVAMRALAEAPEPPVDLIWELIGRANSLAGIAALFVSIIALFN